MNITTNLNEVARGRVLAGESTYVRGVLPRDVEGVEDAYRLFHDRLTELLANLSAEGYDAKLLLNWLPNLYETTDDLAELRDVIENGGFE